MKYMKVTVLVGISDLDMNDWSEHADVTRHLEFIGLHDPTKLIWLHDHDDYPKIGKQEFDKMHKCIDEFGGT